MSLLISLYLYFLSSHTRHTTAQSVFSVHSHTCFQVISGPVRCVTSRLRHSHGARGTVTFKRHRRGVCLRLVLTLCF